MNATHFAPAAKKISYTSRQGEKLALRVCREESGRVVVEMFDGKKLLTLIDLVTGQDTDACGERKPIALDETIVAELKTWDGKVELAA